MTVMPANAGFFLCVIYGHRHMPRTRVSQPTVIKPVRVLKPYVRMNGRTGYHVVIRDRRVPVNPIAR